MNPGLRTRAACRIAQLLQAMGGNERRATAQSAGAGRLARGVLSLSGMNTARLLTSSPPTLELQTTTGVAASIEGDALAVRDREGRLLLEVRADGSIALSAERGDLHLRAARGRVRIEGASGVHVGAPHIVLETPHLRQIVGVLETHARRIVEKARDAYRDVEGTSQLRASQVRIVARKTLRALGERLRLRAAEDAKVQAEKIYLG